MFRMCGWSRGGGEIELSWIPPHGVFEIRVVRKAGSPPAGPRDGERIAASLDQAVDSGLREDQVYHYAIYAIYRMADSRRYPSQGIVVAAFPRLPLPPMNAPRLTITPSGHVRLDWTEPCAVRCGFSAPQCLCPLLRELSSASLLPSNLRETGLPLSGPDRAEDTDPPAAGFCYYTPLVLVGSPLTVGHPAALSRLADPSELRATRTGGPGEERIDRKPDRVAVAWAPEATATRLLARQGSLPRGSSDPDAIVTTVARADYERLGSWTIDLPRTAFAEPRRCRASTGERTGEWFVQPATGPLVCQLPSVLPRSTVLALFLRGWNRVPRPPCRARIRRSPSRIP